MARWKLDARLAAAAALAAAAGAWAQASAWPPGLDPRSPTDEPRAVVRCRVARPGRLAACAMARPAGLTPAEQARVVGWAKSAPPCLVGSAPPGTEIDIPFGVARPLPPVRPALVRPPEWTSPPTPQLLDSVYPEAAQRIGAVGQVVLACEVALNGWARCVVIRERPRGLGFGRAALDASIAFRLRPMELDCRPTSGGRILVPLRFRPRATR